MGAPQRTFIPFDKWLPDAGKLNNPGLRRAWGVVPVYGNYIVSPGLESIGSDLAEEPLGFHLHANQSATLTHQARGYYGTATKLRRLNLSTGGKTDITRAAGGDYAFGSIVPYWNFHSFGDAVVATNYADEVQYVAAPITGLAADMITSTFKPQWRFTFSIGQNLFGANCNIPVTYDGLPTGDNPQLVVWSQNRNLRAFGSENVEPSLVGAGWNSLLNDFGPITGAIGGDFGIVFQRRGHTRIDGPPYEFHSYPEGGCIQPDSICRVGNDVYFWGHRGPSVLRGGEPPVVVLTERSAARTMLDKTSGGFSNVAANINFASGTRNQRVHVAVDDSNGVVRWSYQPMADSAFAVSLASDIGGAFFDYNYLEDRIGVTPVAVGDPEEEANRIFGLGSVGVDDGGGWLPFPGMFGVRQRALGLGSYEYLLFSFDNNSNIPQPRANVTFWTPLGKLSDEFLTRILRVRPIYAQIASTADVSVSVRVSSVNNPRENEVFYGPFSQQDDMGWVVTPETPNADYHSVEVVIDPDATGSGANILEIEGIEVEYAVSRSKYGA